VAHTVLTFPLPSHLWASISLTIPDLLLKSYTDAASIPTVIHIITQDAISHLGFHEHNLTAPHMHLLDLVFTSNPNVSTATANFDLVVPY
jgi:hypothetical protein